MEKKVLPDWLEGHELDHSETLIATVLEHFEPGQITLSTGFGMEGCALIDMASRLKARLEIGYMDTAFFFPETYALIDQMTAWPGDDLDTPASPSGWCPGTERVLPRPIFTHRCDIHLHLSSSKGWLLLSKSVFMWENFT